MVRHLWVAAFLVGDFVVYRATGSGISGVAALIFTALLVIPFAARP